MASYVQRVETQCSQASILVLHPGDVNSVIVWRFVGTVLRGERWSVINVINK